MTHDALKAWLKRKKSSGATARCLLAFAALLAGVLILFLTFWFTYAVIWICVPGISAVSEMAFSKKLKLAHEWRLVLSGGFLLLLFIQHSRTNPLHWGDYEEDDYVSAPGLQAHAGMMGAFAFLLTYPGASANIIASILLTGPRLTIGSWRLWRESRRFVELDEEGCSQLLAFLSGQHSAVAYDALREAGWGEWFGQLRCIDGVIFLEKGITLSSDLKIELLKLQLTESHATT